MSSRRAAVPSPLDTLMPNPDVRKRHSIVVNAPAAVVWEVARTFDMQSVPLVALIFRLRARLLGARGTGQASLRPDDLVRLGWGILVDMPGRLLAAGAACKPWEGDVVFTPVPPERFPAYAEPERVLITWTLEAEPLGGERTRLATETRARGTDAEARRRFRRYWRVFGVGIVGIRWLLLPAIRRAAERRWRTRRGR